MKTLPGYPEALKAAKYLKSRWPRRPRVGIVLGSGLGDVVNQVQGAIKIPYKSIPHFPRPSVKGHSGLLHLGTWAQMPVAVLEGRMHLYEGYAPAEVVFPARVLILAGVEILIVTCAAGGIAPKATPASFMFFSDHLNYQGVNPLAGAHDSRWGKRFVDLSHAYDPELRAKAARAARAHGLKFSEGVYVALLGPNYETPAEIRALKLLGAGAVGMSTVPEVLAARQMGARVLAIATISNRAAGLSKQPLSHEEVLEVGKSSAKNLIKLFDALLPEI
ncbi:MAG TPA: purine-nucleoside phosphorylase [Terriglobia bacterium]|nr:purine-nucleoside phosphorylase [Terriglobia bacterium]